MATKIFLPRLGESIEEATIIRYTKEVGSKLERGDVIAELETAKAMMELENPTGGYLLAVFPQVGETIAKGTLVAIVGKEGENWESLVAEDKLDGEDVRYKQRKSSTDHFLNESANFSNRVNISPNAKRIAKHEGIDLQDLAAAFPDKRISGDDVNTFIESKTKKAISEVPTKPITLNSTQALTARHMVESSESIPQFSVSMVVRVKPLIKKLDSYRSTESPLTVTAVLVKAASTALVDHPLMNAFFLDDMIYQYQDVNIAIAMHTHYGLLAPVLHYVDKLSLEQVAEQLLVLKQKALEKKLSREEVEGGTFTISNLGMLGIRTFVPMVTPKQAAILGVGEIYTGSVEDVDGKTCQQKEMMLTLSADHRVVGGAECAAFFNTYKSIIEKI